MIHLDTSFLIRALIPDSPEDATLRQWLRDGEPIAVSAIAWAEFLCGPVSENVISITGQLLGDAMPFDARTAPIAAQLFNESGRRRGTLADCMVAAVAIANDAALATSNAADFKRLLPFGLRLAGSA